MEPMGHDEWLANFQYALKTNPILIGLSQAYCDDCEQYSGGPARYDLGSALAGAGIGAVGGGAAGLIKSRGDLGKAAEWGLGGAALGGAVGGLSGGGDIPAAVGSGLSSVRIE